MNETELLFTQMARALTPHTYQQVKRAVELGKWPTGERLSAGQLEICMQALISYESAHLAEEQRTGFMPQSCKSTSRSEGETLTIVNLEKPALSKAKAG